MHFIDFLDRGARYFPCGTFAQDDLEALTYRDAVTRSHSIANALVNAGLGPDAKVATWLPNSVAGLCCQFGILRAGVVWLPINVRNGADQNVDILEFAEAEFIFFHSSCADGVRAATPRLPALKGTVCIDQALPDAPLLERWLSANDAPARYYEKGGDDVVSLPTTSGTTGKPKGVMLTNRNWEGIVANCQMLMPYDVRPVHLVVAPLTHAAGYLTSSLLPLGATIVILPKPDPELILPAIEKHRATTLWIPPTVLYRMLSSSNVRNYDYSSLRYLLYGGQVVSSEKLKEAQGVFGTVLGQTYGQTEAPMAASVLLPRDHEQALSHPEKAHLLLSAGRPGPLVQIEAMDEDGQILAPGERGELVYRGSIVMKGYFRNSEATKDVSAHGWHHTGDIGHVDHDGYVFVTDRKRDMIISGGFNIYPAEIEQVVWSHPSVQDCAVIGVPDDEWGEAVTAVIELKPNMVLEASEIIDMCRARLGGVKTPKRVEMWDALPRSSVGKVLKREIRQKYWEGRERAI